VGYLVVGQSQFVVRAGAALLLPTRTPSLCYLIDVEAVLLKLLKDIRDLMLR
jgi:hypothetical protein